MELDDLKNNWESVTNQTAKQNILTYKIIDRMIQKKYNSKLNKIKYPEWIGGTGCLLVLSYIVFNFNKLDTVFFQATGVITILLLIIMPALSFLSLMQFSLANDLNKSYSEAIKQFAYQKKRFVKYQKINVILSYLLLVTTILLLPQFFNGKKDLADNKYFWIFAFSFGYIFLLFFSKWVKKFYSDSLKQAEDLLKETEH